MIRRASEPTSRPAEPTNERVQPRRARKQWPLIVAMVAAIAAVAALAYWDEERESSVALEDFAQEQATLARGVATSIENRLATARRDALVADEDARDGKSMHSSIVESYLAVHPRRAEEPVLPIPTAYHAYLLTVPADGHRAIDLLLSMSNLASGATTVERPGMLLLLIRPPESKGFHTTDGRAFDAPEMVAALDTGATSLRLRPSQAARLGLPQRTALAGLARIDAGALGVWGVATVATAERERDREQRARWRLVLAVAFAGGLVFAFGGAALRTQRKELGLERELALAEQARRGDERLERAGKAATLGTLAMGIAHEVSTPLNVISGRAEQLIPKVAGDERASRSVQTILEQSERIGQVIRAFLGLARGDSPPVRTTEPRAIVAGAMALCEHRFDKAGVSVSMEIPDDLPAIHGDQHLLEHALVNLLLNACDACQPGGHIEVWARVADGSLYLTVDDNGVGIPAADAARAMEPFFTTKAGNGAGLGLAIANEIVKSHHGSLLLAPRIPRGTRATIELPLPNRETK